MENSQFSPLEKNLTISKPEFDLNQVKGHVRLTKSVTIAPFQTIRVPGLTECNQHFKRVNVLVEPNPDRSYESVIPIHGYTVLKPGSSRVCVGLQNHSCHKITIDAKSIVAKVTAANMVPHSLAPNVETEDMLTQLKDGQHQDQENVNCCSAREVPKLHPRKKDCYLTRSIFQVLTIGIPNLLKRPNSYSVNMLTHLP